MDEERTIELNFGPFAWELIAAVAAERRLTTEAFVREACLAFGDRLYGARFSTEAPRFRRRGDIVREVSVALPVTAWTDIQLEAGRQGIGLEELVEHAIMLRLQQPEDVVRHWRRRVGTTRRAGRA